MNFLVLNWKMYPSSKTEAEDLFQKTVDVVHKKVIICLPFIYLPLFHSEKVLLGAQDVSSFSDREHTGEVSAEMLKNQNCQYVLVGHSERRKHETEKEREEKILQVQKNNMSVIFFTDDVSLDKKAISLLSNKDLLVYEPRQNVGTDNMSSMAELREKRKLLKEIKEIPILYGGNVNSHNVHIFASLEFDGIVLGRDSLKREEIGKIENFFV